MRPTFRFPLTSLAVALAVVVLQLVRIEAEGHVSAESLALFDRAIQEAAAQLKTLGDLDAYAEQEMAMGTGLSAGPAAAQKTDRR